MINDLMKEKRNTKSKSDLTKGIIIGVVSAVIISGIIFVIALSSKDVRNKDFGDVVREEFVFNNADVHLNVNKDFAVGVKPVYDREYCKKKFLEKYGKEADECFITIVKTLFRLDPLVAEIECSCKA